MTHLFPVQKLLDCTATNTVALMWVGRWVELPDLQREDSVTFKNGRDAADWLLYGRDQDTDE